MTKKNKKQKPSPQSNNKKSEERDLSEYEDISEDDKESGEKQEIDYDEYELPEDFVPPEEQKKLEEGKEPDNWFQKKWQNFKNMDNLQRFYWIKVLSGVITGTILGLAGAQGGWWLFLLIGQYAIITAGFFFLFNLEFDWKEILLSGFFPYLALFALFWTLMFTALYAPTIEEWTQLLITTSTVNETTTTYITTFTNTTSAGGLPFLEILLTIIGGIGLTSILLKIQKDKEK
ncbi:MAG: EMC6 family protein [Asgard group archaeon]|nr:EMC6 family protein [Asgard group archaeon]